MYIWIGCKLPEDFETELRSHCLAANRHIGLNTAAFSLPQHISLKISFHTPDHEAVLTELTEFLSTLQPFTILLGCAEQCGNILWLPVEENVILQKLHNALDTRLRERFKIPQHPFDKDFLFHTTLFIDKDIYKLSIMERAMTEFPVPRELHIDTFLLGLSPDSTPGSYRVVRTIKV